ncbi:MAG TPA: hypothetical protein VIT24_02585 [Acidimicrobiales bacterium]
MADTLPGLGGPADDDSAESTDGAGLPDADGDDVEVHSGLGRGLAAIIPTLAADLDTSPRTRRRLRRRGGVAALLGRAVEDHGPPPVESPQPGADVVAPTEPAPVHGPAPSAVRKLRDDLVGALLDGLANTMALDLCAYLHEGPGEEPHLFLQSPSMDRIGATRTYALFGGLRVDLEAGRSEAAFDAAGFRGVSVATVGAGSRGLWAVARVEDVTAPEREVAARFCRSFGRAVHQLDGAASPGTTSAIATPVYVEAHRSRDSVLAEVQVRIGDQVRPGHGRADTQVEAITRAVLVAAGRHLMFRYASEVAHEGEHAAVVLLEGGDHAVSLGSALSPESGGVATAQAAIRALDGLAA